MANYLHLNAALLQCAEPALLTELMRRSSLEKFVVKKLSETVVLVEPQKVEEIRQELTKKGYMPSLVQMAKKKER